jgi:outer membrane protein assembly factor BamA
MKHFTQIAILVFALCASWAQREARAQTRSDIIDSERAEKEANLTPETQPKAERRIESVENSLPFRLFTGSSDGLGVSFGPILPGSASGFGVGPKYTRKGLWGGRLNFGVEARGTTKQSYEGQLNAALPNLLGGHAFASFHVQHRDITEMPYYGDGPDSRKTGRSNYRLEDTNVEFRPGVRVFKGLSASLIGSYLAVNTGPGQSSHYISTEQQFGPGTTPGIDRQTNFWRGGGLVEYDWRDRSKSPTSGGRYAAQYVRYLDRDLGAYSFFRLDLDAVQYVPLFNRTHVIRLHGSSSLTDTSGSQSVPFYLQPIMGGPDTLRGFRYGRFYGNNSAMVNAEYRWALSPILEMAAFSDGGKVFNRWEQWNFHDLQSDVGFAVRVKGRTGLPIFGVETAFSHEGFQIWFRLNQNLL